MDQNNVTLKIKFKNHNILCNKVISTSTKILKVEDYVRIYQIKKLLQV